MDTLICWVGVSFVVFTKHLSHFGSVGKVFLDTSAVKCGIKHSKLTNVVSESVKPHIPQRFTVFFIYKVFLLKMPGIFEEVLRFAIQTHFFHLTVWPLSLLKYKTKTLNVKVSLQQLHLPTPALPVSRYGCCPPGKDLTSVSGQCVLFLSK